jgi:glycosyltransferase involved in cell wall biosynthesis
MSTVDFSVVIPTYNRSRVLAATLAALGSQTGGSVPAPLGFEYEVIVVDDGSTDQTAQTVADTARKFPVSLHYLSQPNRKQGAARNLGARRAAGDVLVFLGDDTVPESDFLAEHSRARRGRVEPGDETRLAVIGYTPWAERLQATRFMRYIGEQGWQFGFALIKDRENVPFNFFYTSNLSLNRSFFLESGGFDEGFQEYGWEDIELSVRLKKRGMRLMYHPGAVAQHDHPTSLRSFIERQKKVGYSAWHFYRRHPEMGDFLNVHALTPPSCRYRTRMFLLAVACVMAEKRVWPDLSRYYPDLLSYYYRLGLIQARNANP